MQQGMLLEMFRTLYRAFVKVADVLRMRQGK